MVCVSIGNVAADCLESILGKVEMAEIRLDLMTLADEDIDAVFAQDIPLIATFRTSAGSEVREVERVLTRAVRAGAHYVDLDISEPKPLSKRLAQACSEWGSIMIRSYHDFEKTPDIDHLKAIVDRCRHHDGELVKIAVTAHSLDDVDTVESLYKFYTAESLVAFAMPADDAGDAVVASCRESRLNCLRRGAPFSYAAVSEDTATAPGQIPYPVMFEMVYGGFKSLKLDGIRVPASKSYAQRAVLAAAIAEGTSTLRGFSHCGDSDAALSLAKSLGAEVKLSGDVVGIVGTGGKVRYRPDGLLSAELGQVVLDMGESGLLTRLMAPLSCRLFDGPVRLEGRGTLPGRPLQGAAAMLKALGCKCSSGGDDLKVPFEVCGPLGTGRMVLDGSKSSQMISGAMMALPLQPFHSTLSINNPTSIPYLFVTIDLLRKFGVKIRSEMYGGRQLLDSDWDRCTEIVLKIKENQTYQAADIQLEGDWSAAASFLAAAAVFGRVDLNGLDTASLQADLSILDILMDAGASISQADSDSSGTTGTVTVCKAPLQAVCEDLSNCPDLFPVVAVFCAFCQGKNVLKGVHRLSYKESDRAAAIVDMLKKMGVGVQIKGDDMTIAGESLASRIMNGRLLHGGEFSSFDDHRIVMALKLASLASDSPIHIDNEQCVAKSFPNFTL